MNEWTKQLEQKIIEFTGDHWQEYTPSLQVSGFFEGRKKINLKMGPDYEFYDLASLTKVIFTVSAVMRLVDDGFNLKQSVSGLLPWWRHQNVTVTHLLSHTAGLTWWKPFYKTINRRTKPSQRWASLKGELAKQTPCIETEPLYSDLDFLLLGFVLEAVTGQTLKELWEDQAVRLGLGQTHFNYCNKPRYERSLYAPTESCSWRNRSLRGEVHDDNAWALGGVAPHAGLFGPIADVEKWGLELRKSYYSSRGSKLARSGTVRRFTRRCAGDWGLGFMKPTEGRSSAGQYFSSSSFGHTGFTGTSFWFDPRRDFMVVILSNRVCPSRENKKFIELRPKIHDFSWEVVRESMR
ncbi:MAG: beta-lactamase family protein [Pseudobdellovibrionaceae bacterium]|nr:beta-lactamase family protein [Bdellovibrionales bacterium]USN48338.1 MAG: beta-lactamase family protein [Pseudobdellovibrionaceae bacterium]